VRIGRTSVETERVLVEVVVKMLVAHSPLMRALQEQSGYPPMRHYAVTIIIVLTGSSLYANDIEELYYDLREKEIYKFSLDLFESGEYYRAITEAKRYISAFPNGRNIENAYKSVGDSYLMSREWQTAIQAYDEFLEFFPSSSDINEILFNKAICLVKEENYEAAERLFQRIVNSSEPQKKHKAILWQMLMLIHEKRFKEIEELLVDESVRQRVGQEMGMIHQTVYAKRNAAYKSPIFAGIMSGILPGSGQFYNERYKDGMFSFVFNALFISGAYLAFDHENIPLGIALTIFEAGWYTGSVYGAISGAHKHNRKIDKDIFMRSVQNFELLEYEVRRTPNLSIIFRFDF